MASNRSEFEQLVDRFEPAVRAAFLQAYDDIRSRVTVKALVARLERGDIEGAIDLLGIDRAAFGPLELAVSNAYNGSGIVFAQNMGRASISFGVRNLVAEAILAEYSAQLVTRETENTKAMLRATLSEGLSRGDNPTRSALNMVGRTNRVTGLREGGYLGLDNVQERAQARALTAMISDDPEGMAAYLRLESRDVRFDPMVRKARRVGWARVAEDYNGRLAAGKSPVTARDLQTRIIGRLNAGMLQYRADRLSLNETFTALSMAKNEAVRQAIEAGKIDQRDVMKVWKHLPQEKPRLDHRRLNNTEVPFGQSFIMGDGTKMLFPHDPSGGPKHNLFCKCTYTIKIDHTAALVRRRSAALV